MKYSVRTNGRNGLPEHSNGQSAAAIKTAPCKDQAEVLVAALRGILRDMFIVDDAASDLPLRQLRLCALLTDGPQSMSALSRELDVSLSAITQLADRLVTAGLAERVAEQGDRRVRCLQLTTQGRQIMHRRQRIKIRRAQAALRRLSAAERRKLLDAVATLQHASHESRQA
jgi:DNA-binding MarR family transcriptional regulator